MQKFDPTSEPRNRRPGLIDSSAVRRLAPAILLSLALHAGISIWILSTEFRFETDPARDRVVSLSLLPARSEPAPQSESESNPEPPEAPEPEVDPDPRPRRPEPVPPQQTIQARPAVVEPVGNVAPADADSNPSAQPSEAITARLLQQVRQLHAPNPAAASRDASAWTRPGAPVAGLPGHRGWLSGYVGEVTASADQWKAPNGSQEARHVLPDGTVVCTRRRAPTAEELIHPMRAMIVTMARVCGRQRPEAPDYSDLAVRPPPG